MTLRSKKRGMIFPLILLGLFSLAFLVVFIHSMGQGFSTQVVHAQEHLVARAIGQSVFSQVMGKIMNKPYSERFFYPQPFLASNEKLFGGFYDLYVVDTPGKTNQVDIYVNVSYFRARRLFFWRVLIDHSILNAAGRILPIIFTPIESDNIPSGGAVSPFSAYINDILKKRKENALPAAGKAAALLSSSSLKDDLNILDGPTGDNVINFDDPQPVKLPVSKPLPKPPAGPFTKIFEDTFADTPIGGYPAGWENLVSGISCKVVQGGDGNKYLEMTGMPGYARCDVVPVTLEERFAYECEIEFPNESHGGSVGFQYYVHVGQEGYLRPANRFTFENNGILHFVGKNSSAELGRWNPNTRYTIRAELDFITNTANIYLNGELRGEDTPIFPRSFESEAHGGDATLNKIGIGTRNVSGDEQPVVKVHSLKLFQ